MQTELEQKTALTPDWAPRKTIAKRMSFSGPTVVGANGILLVADRTPSAKDPASDGAVADTEIEGTREINVEFLPAVIGGFEGIRVVEENVDELPTDKPIVFFCSTGARSGEAYDIVKMKRDDLNVYFLDANVAFNQNGSVPKATPPD